MTDKVLKEAYEKIKFIEEGQSPEEAQINVLTLRMRRATEEDDEAAYHRAVDQLNALTDKMQSKPSTDGDDWDTDTGPGENSNAWNDIEESADPGVLHDAAIDLLDDMLAAEQYSEKADILRYAIKRLQEVGLGR